MRISERVYLVGSEQFGLSHPLDCNCYLIDGGSAVALVDSGTGMGVDDILANMAADGFEAHRLTHILITHAHVGHFGGADELRQRTGAQVLAPALAVGVMTNLDNDPATRLNFRFGRYPAGFTPRTCIPDGTYTDGDEIAIGEITIRAIHTQGHTKDSTCLLFEAGGSRCLCSGDTVFYAGKIGLLNLEGCSLDDYRRDIQKIAALDIQHLFPGHGVFVLRKGQKHINRAVHKLGDFVLPDTFFEDNEFMWERDYLKAMTG